VFIISLNEHVYVRVLKKRVLRKILRPKRDRWQESEDSIMKSFMICTPYQILFRWSNQQKWDGQGQGALRETGKVYTRFWWGDLMEGDHLEDLDIGGRATLKWIFKTWDGEAWAGLLWPRTETGDGHLWMF